MGDPKRSLEIRRKYQLRKEQGYLDPVRGDSLTGGVSKCKYCGTEIRVNANTKTPVCKDLKCRRAYGVDRVLLYRKRRREREQKAKEEN